MSGANKTVIIICGPTAVGKTSFAIKLAQHLHTQIVSADSRQCYKELNIGVAKPSVQQLKSVHHYFISTYSVTENVNAANFEQDALNATNQIFESSDYAVMVGGTGLYLKAFEQGLDEMPVIDESIRKEISQQYQLNGLGWLQSQVQQYDPEFWQVAEQKNPHRLIRALEVKLSTQTSILHLRKGQPKTRPFGIVKVGLELPRPELHHNINTRVDEMMNEGLLNEVKNLYAYRNLQALQTVGYKELFAYLDGETNLDQATEAIKINTRHYAKRQLTWFKKDPEITWHSAQDVLVEGLLKTIKSI